MNKNTVKIIFYTIIFVSLIGCVGILIFTGNNNTTDSLETYNSTVYDSINSNRPTESTQAELQEQEQPININPYDFTVCFAGDINLDENWGTTIFMDSQENGIYDCISSELMEHMQNADIMCLNNEFTYSTRGEKLAGKLYHFRANPERVEVLKEMGVDIVKLANNHACDYGEESLLDTMDTLKNAGIGSSFQSRKKYKNSRGNRNLSRYIALL